MRGSRTTIAAAGIAAVLGAIVFTPSLSSSLSAGYVPALLWAGFGVLLSTLLAVAVGFAAFKHPQDLNRVQQILLIAVSSALIIAVLFVYLLNPPLGPVTA